jgi:ribonuclease R
MPSKQNLARIGAFHTMTQDELQAAILGFVQRKGYKPVKPRVIAQWLGVPKSEAPSVKKAIRRLMARGALRYGPNHLILQVGPSPAAESGRQGKPGEPRKRRERPQPVRPAPDAGESAVEAAAEGDVEDAAASVGGERKKSATGGKPVKPTKDRIIGVFRRAEGGFGFVRPSTVKSADRSSDIYIAADKAGDASSGDRVAVRLRKMHGGHTLGLRGEIVEIIERQTSQFVGTYFESRGAAYVQIDGPLFTKPIAVGDPGARNAQTNDKVVIEMLRFPSPVSKGEGVIIEVLGSRGKPGVDTLSVIRGFNLPDRFPDDVLEDARRQAEAFDESAIDGRHDATHETVITIDPADARDFDDAISLEMTGKGHWRLGVHIADVSHFVPVRSPLDREATDRATSVYLPDRVIPMLPEIISNGLASLQPGKVRYTKTAYLEFSPEGIRVSTELRSAAIKSCRRFTYEEVDDFLANPEAWRKKLTPAVHGLLTRMRELAVILRTRRKARGSLELTMPEVKIDLDKEGRVAGAHVVPYTESHQMIEEFMLSANEAVAERLADRKLHFLRRIHQAPKLEKLELLGDFVAELGLPHDDLVSRFGLQRLLAAVVGRPEQYAVNYAVLRSLQRAVYSPQEEGHFALASDCYCHFTSPIRRYPDLTIHRLVDALIHGKKTTSDYGQAVILGEHCSQREQRAEAAERELTKVKLLDYMSTRIGEQMDAVITGVESFGLFAQGLELPAEGLVHIQSLVDDFYRFDRATHTLCGNREGNSYRLGDTIRVEVVRVDLERRELDFRVVGHKGKARQAKPVAPSRPGPRPPREGLAGKPRKTSLEGRAKRESPPTGRRPKSKPQGRTKKPPRKRGL